ncbi:E3 ubiquitin-protein ligase Praja-1-like [Argonauta hians]
MQDNQQNPQHHLSIQEDFSNSSDEASGTDNPDGLPHSNVTATSITIKGARPKVYSSFLKLSKSKSARFSQKSDEGQENTSQQNPASVDLNISSLTTSSSFLSNRHSLLPDIKPLNSIQENPCNREEPLQRWKNAGKALRKALSTSASSFAVSSPLSSYVNQTFHFSTQTLPLKSKGSMKSGRYHLTRKNLLDNDSIAVCETSKLLNDMPISSPILSSSKIPHSSIDSANVDINIDNQAEVLKNSVAISLPKTSPYIKHQKDDNCSKSENEIDPTSDSCMLERSPGMFNLRADDCDLPQTTDHNNSNSMMSASQTDLNLSRYQRQMASCPRQLNKSAPSPFTSTSKTSTSPVCSFEDNTHTIQSQTFKMLECRLSRLISSDDKSFFELSSSNSDITDCSSIFEDDFTWKSSSHQHCRRTAHSEEQEPKKQKRKSQTLRKHRNGEAACSSDSIHEGTRNYLRQKKKMKGGLEETLEHSALQGGGCLAALQSNMPCLGLSHSSETDSDSAAKTVLPHWRFRKRSGISTKRHEGNTGDNSKEGDEFKLPPLPLRTGAKGGRRYARGGGPSTKDHSDNCSSTDRAGALGSLCGSRASLVNYSSSSSLDILNVCDRDQTLPPSWNIVDSLNPATMEGSSDRTGCGGGVPSCSGRAVEDLSRCEAERSAERSQSQVRTWPVLDDLFSYSNENVSSLINVGCPHHDVHCSEEDEYSGVSHGRCSCNKCEPSTWDFWDLPPSESTLIDIAIDADCPSESDTHSDLERDSDSADADDEFECDCIHCLQVREVLGHRHNSEGASIERGGSDLTTTTTTTAAASSVSNSSSLPYTMSTSSSLQFATRLTTPLSQDHNHWSSALSEDSQLDIAELNPLDLLLMRQDARRDMLELMFQNVILQMLAVHPDLLNDQAPPPAPLTIIENLQTVLVTQEDINEEASCPICLCPWELEENMAKLPCQHLFHMLCIRAWLVKSGTCPVCRHVL